MASGVAIGFFMTASATSTAAATRTWDGGGANTNWMNATNWVGNVAPVAGDDLVFPAGVANTEMVNDFPDGTKFASLTFYADYDVDGNRILIGSTITQVASAEASIDCDLTIEAGLLSPGLTFAVAENAAIYVSGNIDSTAGPFQPGMRKIGLGRLRLIASNTYGGVTAIQEGELRIHHQAALGSATWSTVVTDGAVLSVDVDGIPSIAEPLQLAGPGTASALDGALTFMKSANMTGTVALSGGSAPVIAAGGANGVGEISGVISGSAGLTKAGPGLVRLSGANIYDGPTTVAANTLIVAHPQALGTTSSGVTVAVGGTIRIDTALPIDEPLFATGNGGGYLLQCLTPSVCTWAGPVVIEGKVNFQMNAGHTLRLSNNISGNGDVDYISGEGRIELGGNNSTYTGKTFIGDLKLLSAGAIPDGSYVLFFGDPGTLDLAGFSEAIGSITGAVDDTINLGAAYLTIDTAEPFSQLHGPINGSGGITKKGVGTLALSNAKAYTGVTTLEAGVINLASTTVLSGPVSVVGGILRGGGHLDALAANAGRIEPGQSVGILTAKTLKMGPMSTLALDLNGPAVGTEHDQVVATVQIALDNTKLELASAKANAFSTPLTIVKNDGADPVTGTFAGLPEGALVFTSMGRGLTISYVGGDGNDIVVTPSTPTYYLSEGATGQFFETDILIANPGSANAPVTLTFLKSNGKTLEWNSTVSPRSRTTFRINKFDGLESTSVSTVVTSINGQPLIVERTMRWGSTNYGAHTEKAVTSLSNDWYFAEGSQGFFSTYVLLANPQPTANVATIRYFRENLPPIERTYPIEANSRFTVDAGADPDLVGSSFGMHVTFEQPGAAERAMYFGMDPLYKAGHESAGVTEPSKTWFLAEGATGPLFETFVLLANPGDTATDATVTFLPDTGMPVTKIVPIAAQSRVTLNIEAEDPSLANAAVATQVSATQPILVERAQYWPDPAPQWYEAHNSFGVTATSTKWGLAEGRSGGDASYQTYILLANPGADAATVTVMFLPESGHAPVERTYTVQPFSRFNVDTGGVEELADSEFGAVITADRPIVVERAMYSNDSLGQLWAAGTNATGTPLP